MSRLVCGCGRVIPASAPSIGVIEADPGEWFSLVNCGACGSTRSRPVPRLIVTAKGIVGRVSA